MYFAFVFASAVTTGGRWVSFLIGCTCILYCHQKEKSQSKHKLRSPSAVPQNKNRQAIQLERPSVRGKAK
jgi:hypothetical protein